jgi:hypothetical protein
VDSVQASNTGFSIQDNTVLTGSFNNVAGTLLVCGATVGATAAVSITSMTYNGVSMTRVTGANFAYDGATHNFVAGTIFYLTNPATGANNVVLTVSNSGGSQTLISGCISFKGNTGSPLLVTNSATRESSATTANVAVAGTTSGSIIVAILATGSGWSSTANTNVYSANVDTRTAGGNGEMSRAAGTGGTVNMNNTITSDFMGIGAAEFK